MTDQPGPFPDDGLRVEPAPPPVHGLIIKPCQGCAEAGELTCTCEPQQWDVSIVCPGVTDNCRTWWECMDCNRGDDDLDEQLWEMSEAHGEVHQYLEHGWSTPGAECWGQAFPELRDAVEGLFGQHPIQPGEYRVQLIPDDQYLYLKFADDAAQDAKP